MPSDIYSALGLQSNPFPAGACSDNYYHTEATRRILDEFIYGLKTRKGFLVLVGEVGLGKTSLLLQLLNRLGEENLSTAWIFNTVLKKDEILQAIARDFGLDVPPRSDVSQTIDILHQYFLENNRLGHNCAIIIDEAHNLDFESLEMLRMLSNLELGGDKLVQILLVGQPELKARLWQPELRQFRSRINIYVELPFFTREETAGYVNYKFTSAGSDLHLEGKALDMLYVASQGNLRTVNLIMEKVLYALVALGDSQVTPQAVRDAVQDISPCQLEVAERLARHTRRGVWGKALGLAALFLLVLASAGYLLQDRIAPYLGYSLADRHTVVEEVADSEAAGGSQAVVPADTAPAQEQAATPQGASAGVSVASAETQQGTEEAMAAVQALPESAPAPAQEAETESVSEPASAVPDGFAEAALDFLAPMGKNQLTAPLRLSVEQASTVPLQQAVAVQGGGWAIVEMAGGAETLPPGRGKLYTLFPWRAMAGSGPTWLALWQPSFSVPNYIPDYSGPEVKDLQRMLRRLGYYRRGIDGKVGSGTWRGIHEFQKKHGLEQSGRPDPVTLLWLHAMDREQ